MLALGFSTEIATLSGSFPCEKNNFHASVGRQLASDLQSGVLIMLDMSFSLLLHALKKKTMEEFLKAISTEQVKTQFKVHL